MRRLAAAQLAEAALGLSGGGDADKAVHEARKSIKKVRSLLRLVRYGLDVRRAENDVLRDIARSLAPLREAGVLEALAARLAEEAGVAAPALTGGAAMPNDPAERIAAAAAALEAASGRAKDWPLQGKPEKVLRKGIERIAAAAQAAMEPALAAGEAEAMHEFRKRVKDRWYAARLLEPCWPEMMAPEVAAADALGEMLGDHHDLAELGMRLPAKAPKALRRLIDDRSDALLAEIRPLARRLHAEAPEALAARWTAWWAQSPLAG